MFTHIKQQVLMSLCGALLAAGFLTAAAAGEQEPGAGPGSTGIDLLQLMNSVVGPLPTGFELWAPNRRFAVWDNATEDTADDVVLDRATGFMWARDPEAAAGGMNWADAREHFYGVFFGNRADWRLPSIEELVTLTEPYPAGGPALPEAHPFVNVQISAYWSAGTCPGVGDSAYVINLFDGSLSCSGKAVLNRMWPMRGGADLNEMDNDGDGITPEQGDCDDGNPNVYLSALEEPYNGIDEDCDGRDYIDDDRDTHHSMVDCFDNDAAIHPGAREICDGKNNDCDSSTPDGDNDTLIGIECDGGDRDLCKEGVYVCEDGFLRCDDDPDENDYDLCDGIDNDCDPETEDGTGEPTFGAPCDGPDADECNEGTWTLPCSGGSLTCSDTTGNDPEICDEEAADEDCDGTANEDCDCIDNATRDCGTDVGECQPGTQECSYGAWGPCENATGPSDEVCDPAESDEDCDGSINEGCTCTNGTEKNCGTDVGACEAGTQVCSGGVWGPCEGSIGPSDEECDADELDENCDGFANPWCACITGASRTCGSEVGECVPGSQTCVMLDVPGWGRIGTWSECQGAIGPSKEECDGKDNDCDPSTPDGSAEAEFAADEVECADRPDDDPCHCDGTDDDSCLDGYMICEDGEWQCYDQHTNAANRPDEDGLYNGFCTDGIDNDCNGVVDCPTLGVTSEFIVMERDRFVLTNEGMVHTDDVAVFPMDPDKYDTMYDNNVFLQVMKHCDADKWSAGNRLSADYVPPICKGRWPLTGAWRSKNNVQSDYTCGCAGQPGPCTSLRGDDMFPMSCTEPGEPFNLRCGWYTCIGRAPIWKSMMETCQVDPDSDAYDCSAFEYAYENACVYYDTVTRITRHTTWVGMDRPNEWREEFDIVDLYNGTSEAIDELSRYYELCENLSHDKAYDMMIKSTGLMIYCNEPTYDSQMNKMLNWNCFFYSDFIGFLNFVCWENKKNNNESYCKIGNQKYYSSIELGAALDKIGGDNPLYQLPAPPANPEECYPNCDPDAEECWETKIYGQFSNWTKPCCPRDYDPAYSNESNYGTCINYDTAELIDIEEKNVEAYFALVPVYDEESCTSANLIGGSFAGLGCIVGVAAAVGTGGAGTMLAVVGCGIGGTAVGVGAMDCAGWFGRTVGPLATSTMNEFTVNGPGE
ncbi:DUF1566 domain-containing protein [Thermodesulfobacteriota bacterium]